MGDKARTSLASCDGISSERQAADKPETGRRQIKDYLAQGISKREQTRRQETGDKSSIRQPPDYACWKYNKPQTKWAFPRQKGGGSLAAYGRGWHQQEEDT